MKIFNEADEIVKAIGIIGNDIAFDKWEPLLKFGLRDVAAIIGRDCVAAICAGYEESYPYDSIDPEMKEAVEMLQQAAAMFTWLKIIPTLDAQHDGSGRGKRLGENEKGLTALQEYKDEENILRLAYEAVDALIEWLDDWMPDFWAESEKCRMRKGLIVSDKATFDCYYTIGSHRLFVTLLPMIREVQGGVVAPVLGRYLTDVLNGDDHLTNVADLARRVVVLLTMKKAVERLPVEVLPEGIVQVNQTQPVKSRLKAEKSARQSVAASLGEDAREALSRLEALIADLDGVDDKNDYSTRGPIVHSKGISF